MAKVARKSPRNYEIAKGIMRWTRSAVYAKKGLYKIKDKKFGYQKANKTTAAAKQHKVCRKLRPTLTPGTIVIIVAGPMRGRKAVFLKQLESGLLLVSGPYKCNGVPLRRLNPVYCIATSTKIDVSDVQIPKDINDAYFKRIRLHKSSKDAKKMLDKVVKTTTVSQAKKDNQKAVDEQLLKKINAVPMLKEYISSLFSIPRGKAVHTLKF